MPFIIPRGSPLAYPTGVKPGYDSSHIAVNRGRVFSAVSLVRGFVNVRTGVKGTISGTPSFVMNSVIGPTTKYANATDKHSFAGQSTATDTPATIAMILVFDQFTGSSAAAFSTASNGGGWALYHPSSFQMLAAGVSNIDSAIAPTTGVPYFIVCSHSEASPQNTNFLVRNLRTGVITTATIAGSANSAAPNGTFEVGNATFLTVSFTSIAAVMFAPMYMTMEALFKWADDPWSFWYPRRAPYVFAPVVGIAIPVLDRQYRARWL